MDEIIDLSKANSFVIKTDVTDHFSLAFFIKNYFITKTKDNIINQKSHLL